MWVTNASPLILLGKIGEIDLISRLGTPIAVPEGVAAELRAGPPGDPARVWIEGSGAGWVAPVERIDPLIATWDLGIGESHVLTLCRMLPGAEAILDDRAARNCAVTLSIRVRGTLSLIVLAKRKGLIRDAKALFQGLLDHGIRVAPDVIETALRLAGER